MAQYSFSSPSKVRTTCEYLRPRPICIVRSAISTLVADFLLKTHDDLLSDLDTEGHVGHAHAQVLDKNSQIFFDKSIRLLQQMSNLITMTLEAWTKFRDRELAYFSDLEQPSGPGRHPPPELLIVEINRDLENLQALRTSLDHQRDHLNALLQKVIHWPHPPFREHNR